MMIHINTFEKLELDGVMFGKWKNWLVVISQEQEIVHLFTSTDERILKSMMKALIKKQRV